MSARPPARSPLLSVYNAALVCRGFVLFRGRGGFEAYDVNTQSFGFFAKGRASSGVRKRGGRTMSMVDPRLAFLARASARLILVEVGEMDLDTAFAELVPAFREIAGRHLIARCLLVGSTRPRSRANAPPAATTTTAESRMSPAENAELDQKTIRLDSAREHSTKWLANCICTKKGEPLPILANALIAMRAVMPGTSLWTR